MATAQADECEALKVVIRGESHSKTYGIRKRLDQELTRQEDVLTALQRQIDNGYTPESACLEVRGRIVELWDRLDSYVPRNYRQQLYQEGDRLGRMLAWLLRRERPVPIIQMLCGPSGELILGQLWVHSHLPEHLLALYTAPCGVDVAQIGEYLDGLRLPRLTETQSEELEGEVSLDDLVEVLGGMAFRRTFRSTSRYLVSHFLLTQKCSFQPLSCENHESPATHSFYVPGMLSSLWGPR
ncbi:hypothetical protein NDU88_000994 [Pleurodeles waltl]|uniref:Uncharacterized protein n=1 Tax=Pleurodeles waltl TaxID=8319 RepID=A0AAV7MRH8_PLEWA|nr:hypothetical protein NDU88_000994 [Pleurodeles waltl]